MTPRHLHITTLAIAVAQALLPHTARAQHAPAANAAAAPVLAIESVTVHAQRTTNATARLAQQEVPNLINLMTAEDMRKRFCRIVGEKRENGKNSTLSDAAGFEVRFHPVVDIRKKRMTSETGELCI